MHRRAVNTLILDLDNTIFDWFALWYASFSPVYQAIIDLSGKPIAIVEEDIRRVHQARGTSEYSFLIEELSVLDSLGAADERRLKLKHALDLSSAGRDAHLKLYPSVFNTLWDIKKRGTKIIAYTESMGFYSAYRLKRFGLDGVIDVLFSPKDHDTPKGVSLENMRRLPADFYQLSVTEVRHTPPGALKPNTAVLLDILKTVGAKPDQCAYVGDSLFKDVAMARDVGVYDIHAKYGESQKRPEYSLLQRVSHWTADDVAKEKAITDHGREFEPSATLVENFAEIYKYCDFETFPIGSGSLSASETAKNAIEVWKKCVDVQQHFNDLEMRIRNFALTVVGALIAGVSFTYQYGLQTQIAGLQIPAGAGFVAAAIFAWGGFFVLDLYWYHVFLKGTVKHTAKLEERFKDLIPGIDLGKSISQESQGVKILKIPMNSDRRLKTFYLIGLIMLLIVFTALFFAKPAIRAANMLPPTAASAGTGNGP